MSSHVFARAPQIGIQRSTFDRSHNLKTTLDVDYLFPIYVDEALPGDTVVMRQHLFGRLTTPLTPIMDNLYLDTFYFAVPLRLVDKDFKKFMGEKALGDTTSAYVAPMLNTGTGVAFESLYDYLGIPPGVANVDFDAWYPRAYNLIWNEFFRDENLVDEAPIAGVHSDGTVTTEALSDYVLRKRGKRHDYFTSCLPTPQLAGDISMPLGSLAPVVGNGNALGVTEGTYDYIALGSMSGSAVGSYTTTGPQVIGASPVTPVGTNKVLGVVSDPSLSGLVADLSSASAATVNQLREAFATQQLAEAWMRGGHRYTEILRSCFQCITPDSRLQRPEYLGGASVPLSVNTVAQTSESTATSPLGNLASFVTVSHDASFVKSFTEHCIVIGLANIRADLSYQQGLPRMFSRKTKFDFYWPQLASLGEMAVLNRELYCQGDSVTDASGNIVDAQPFGYQERWAEYRYHPNTITGKMRSTDPQSLDVWHLAQKFDSLPTLNQTFIEEAVPIDRVVAVTDEPPFILDGWFDCKWTRPMPLYSIPGLRRM